MVEERFSASDLEPSDDDRRAALRERVDRGAAALAVLATGMWIGGLVALGACAAPAVFHLTPAPYSGNAMGAAFASFDRIALGGAALTLAAEVARTWAAGRGGVSAVARVRRLAAIVLALLVGYGALIVTPKINELHLSGAVRGVGPEGELLDAIHKRAEMFGKIEVVLGILVVVLHVLTLKGRREEESESPGPLPPGPTDD